MDNKREKRNENAFALYSGNGRIAFCGERYLHEFAGKQNAFTA